MDAEVTEVSLDEIYAAELEMIALRRAWVRETYGVDGKSGGDVRGDASKAAGPGPDAPKTTETADPASAKPANAVTREVQMTRAQPDTELVGLALSGGGIRSAAFCMGVLQALNRAGVYRRIDYISTVSGGGYVGAALSATSYVLRGGFALDNVEGPEPTASDIEDSPTVVHIRNYSNFLAPQGLRDWIISAAMIARGIVTSLIMVAPWILMAAVLTLAYNPTIESLHRMGPWLLEPALAGPLAGWLTEWLSARFGAYAWPALGAAVLVAAYFGWSWARSRPEAELTSEFSGRIARRSGLALVLVLASLALSFQNALLAYMLTPATPKATAAGEPGFLHVLQSALLASPLVVLLVNAFRDKLAKLARAEANRWSGALAKQGSRLALLAGASAMPLLLWLFYMWIVQWGLQCSAARQQCLTWPHSAKLAMLRPLGDWLSGALDTAFRLAGWLSSNDQFAFAAFHPAAALAGLAALLFLATLGLGPNAHSLHRLYRDRLAKAFVVHPVRRNKDVPRDLDFVHRLRLSQLVRKATGNSEQRFVHAPFPLMNTALNVQGSDKVNRRGRNADFFMFSPLHAGSPSTGYVRIGAIEQADANLNLAAVMAISGAAANSNMGANTIRPMSTTLALLNVRLGYWLPNPRRLIEGTYRGRCTRFLWREMISSLDENTDRVLLTDGGHIENLGVYELLRRKCKVIVVADAEADGEMNFSSLITLQRYARIDLGVRIELPWPCIAEATRAVMTANAGKGPMPDARHGPHAALGLIHYDGGKTGYLLYLKSSLTGDENDNVRDYGRRNPSFPHETTADQFFSEEQFEVYRALGFHVTFDALGGRADIALPGGALGRFGDAPGKGGRGAETPLAQLKAILGL